MHYNPSAFDRAQPLLAPSHPLAKAVATLRDAWKFGLELTPADTAREARGLDLIAAMGAEDAPRAAALAWRLKERGIRRVAILGLITHDGAWGPVFQAIGALKDAGIMVRAYEAALPQHRAPDLLCDSLEEALEGAEAVLLVRRDASFLAAAQTVEAQGGIILDL